MRASVITFIKTSGQDRLPFFEHFLYFFANSCTKVIGHVNASYGLNNFVKLETEYSILVLVNWNGHLFKKALFWSE